MSFFKQFNLNTPLYEKIRPKLLSEVIGQEHILGDGKFLQTFVASQELISLIFWGPPGIGKTTIAQTLAKACGYEFIPLSAMFTSIAEVKTLIEQAEKKLEIGKRTVLFIDEIHRFNIKQQDIFLPILESGSITLLGATTENPSFYLNKALLSRCQVVELNPFEAKHFLILLERVEQFLNKSLNLDHEIINYLINASGGDGRYFISMLETLNLRTSKEQISLEQAKDFIRKRAHVYDKNKEEHYNLISALHKSIRGSDEQASLYWFSRMVEGGEDLNYIARRLLRIAAEDVGLADPSAVAMVIAAWNSFERLGNPEGVLMLAEAVIYLALAPKSNRVYIAAKKATAFAQKTSNVKPPKHILNAPTSMMQELGYANNYQYDHDVENSFSGQHYFPEKMAREIFYVPKDLGYEKELKRKIEYFNNLRNRKL